MTDSPLDDEMLRGVPVVQGFKLLYPVVLHQQLGKGGMGAVYRGRHLNLDIDVALKCLLERAMGSGPDAVARFRNEARTVARIRSPNLVGVLDVLQRHGLHYIVMELVDGETVGGRVRRCGPLDARTACTIAVAATRGLAAAHAADVIHRDVKPPNVLISRAGEVKLTDLGIAKAADAFETVETNALALLGTPKYMAPEQFDGATHVRKASDVYAMAATLTYMLLGRDPIPGRSITEIMRAVHVEGFPDIATLCDGLPDPLAALIRRSTSREVGDRPEDAPALLVELEACLAHLGGPVELADAEAGGFDDEGARSPTKADLRRIHESLDDGGAPLAVSVTEAVKGSEDVTVVGDPTVLDTVTARAPRVPDEGATLDPTDADATAPAASLPTAHAPPPAAASPGPRGSRLPALIAAGVIGLAAVGAWLALGSSKDEPPPASRTADAAGASTPQTLPPAASPGTPPVTVEPPKSVAVPPVDPTPEEPTGTATQESADSDSTPAVPEPETTPKPEPPEPDPVPPEAPKPEPVPPKPEEDARARFERAVMAAREAAGEQDWALLVEQLTTASALLVEEPGGRFAFPDGEVPGKLEEALRRFRKSVPESNTSMESDRFAAAPGIDRRLPVLADAGSVQASAILGASLVWYDDADQIRTSNLAAAARHLRRAANADIGESQFLAGDLHSQVKDAYEPEFARECFLACLDAFPDAGARLAAWQRPFLKQPKGLNFNPSGKTDVEQARAWAWDLLVSACRADSARAWFARALYVDGGLGDRALDGEAQAAERNRCIVEAARLGYAKARSYIRTSAAEGRAWAQKAARDLELD